MIAGRHPARGIAALAAHCYDSGCDHRSAAANYDRTWRGIGSYAADCGANDWRDVKNNGADLVCYSGSLFTLAQFCDSQLQDGKDCLALSTGSA